MALKYSQPAAVQVRNRCLLPGQVPAWWWFEDSFYWESGSYSERDVMALIRDRQRRATQRLDEAHMLLNVNEGL